MAIAKTVENFERIDFLARSIPSGHCSGYGDLPELQIFRRFPPNLGVSPLSTWHTSGRSVGILSLIDTRKRTVDLAELVRMFVKPIPFDLLHNQGRRAL